MADHHCSAAVNHHCSGAVYGPDTISRNPWRISFLCSQRLKRNEGLFDPLILPVGSDREVLQGRSPDPAPHVDAENWTVSSLPPASRIASGGGGSGPSLLHALFPTHRNVPQIQISASALGGRYQPVFLSPAAIPLIEIRIPRCAVSSAFPARQRRKSST